MLSACLVLLGVLLTPPHYVGSKACAACHADIYARWRKTPMANVVRDPRRHPEALQPAWAHRAPLVKFSESDIALVYGSLWKQRYFKKVGNDYYVEPAQWDFANHVWRPFFVSNRDDWWAPLFPPDNFQRPTGQLCDGCHSVAYDIQTKTPVEWNVGCERCHGPGSAHVAQPTAANILDPSALDSQSAADVCIQCHSQGRPRAGQIGGKWYDWPVGYHVGLRLADYWKLEDHRLGETNFYYFADGTARKNRMQGNDFVQSLMYTRGVTCYTCHDVHGTANPAQLRKPPQAMCLTCHGPGSPRGPRAATISAHTHHAPGSAGSQCIACHMPQIETEGMPGEFVHAHTFKFINPAATEKYGIPNPCNVCHKDKSPAWAAAQTAQWYSPWRMQN